MDKENQKEQAHLSAVTDMIAGLVKGALEKIKEGDSDNDSSFVAGNDTEKDSKIAKAKEAKARIEKWKGIWKNNGVVDNGTKVQINDMIAKSNELANKATDAVTSQWARNMIPNVISSIVREPISLGNPLTQLLTPVRFSNGTSITLPALGAAGNINCDMGEGEEYPILDLDLSGTVNAHIGKSGIAVSFTEEAIRYSAMDLITLHSRQAVSLLERHKERKAANMIFNTGSTFIDNTNASARHSKGRSISMDYNNTLIVDDLLDAYTDALREGYKLDTLIVHPLAFQIFSHDPILREQFFRGISGGKFFSAPNGQAPYYQSLGVNSPYGKNIGPAVGVGLQSNNGSGNKSAGTLAFEVPNYGGFGFNVIVSNYANISWNSTLQKYVTDIAMIQAEHAGLLIVDEELTTEDWKDPSKDIMKIKFRERYALANVNQGKAGRILKGIVIDRAYFGEDKVIWDAATGALPSSSTTVV
jgi:hypothetical protein